MEKLELGNGMNPGVTQGPLINKSALEKVQNHVEDALQKGGKILTGGKMSELGGTYF